MIKVSVIVPVHNAEPYLDQCLESLLNQNLKEIEVIAVNNGSVDDSIGVLKKHQAKHPHKLKVFDIPQGDVSIARSIGLDNAVGEYVGFVDSDDYVDLSMYEKLYTKAKQNDFDICVCDVIAFFEDTDQTSYLSSMIEQDITTLDDMKKSFVNSHPLITSKIFRRSIIGEKYRFTPGIFAEDVEFLYRVYPEMKSIGVIKEGLYFYRQRSHSLAHTFNEGLLDYVQSFDNIVKHYKDNGFFNDYQKELEYQYVRTIYASMIKRLAKAEDKQIFDHGVSIALNAVKTNFPGYRKNPNFYSQGLKGLYLIMFNKTIANIIYRVEHKKKFNLFKIKA